MLIKNRPQAVFSFSFFHLNYIPRLYLGQDWFSYNRYLNSYEVHTLFFSRFISLIKVLRFRAVPPTAAQIWQQSNGEAKHHYWLFAWPVHMLLGRDSFFLTEPAPLTLSADESSSLIASLNAHFETQAMHFYLQNDQWFLGLDNDPKIATNPLSIAKNKDVAPLLPVGEGALAWASLQNEIQMLLFDHPINLKREQAGLLTINSLWCDGLGKSESSYAGV